jgi:hypothetical protein
LSVESSNPSVDDNTFSTSPAVLQVGALFTTGEFLSSGTPQGCTTLFDFIDQVSSGRATATDYVCVEMCASFFNCHICFVKDVKILMVQLLLGIILSKSHHISLEAIKTNSVFVTSRAPLAVRIRMPCSSPVTELPFGL